MNPPESSISIARRLCVVVLGLAWIGLAEAQLGAGGLQSSSGLDGSKRNPSSRKAATKPQLESTSLRGAGRLESARPAASRLRAPGIDRSPASAAAADRVFSRLELEGAMSSIPPSRIGELLYDVARELEAMEEDVDDIAVGYYMAALADPEGERYDDAGRRLKRIFLHSGLSHEEAVQLYDGGLSTFAELSEPRIGLTRDGLASARRDLRKLKAEYHRRRSVSGPVDPASSEPRPSPAYPTPSHH